MYVIAHKRFWKNIQILNISESVNHVANDTRQAVGYDPQLNVYH